MAKLSQMVCAAVLASAFGGSAAFAATELSKPAETIARAIANAGCRVSEANADKILGSSGLSEAEASAAVTELLDSSLADQADGDLVLEPKFCTSMGGRADLAPQGVTVAALTGAGACLGTSEFAGHSADKISTLQSEGCL